LKAFLHAEWHLRWATFATPSKRATVVVDDDAAVANIVLAAALLAALPQMFLCL